MKTTTKAVALLAAASLAGGATAQTAGKPKATYWVSAETTSGMGAMGASAMAAAATGGEAPAMMGAPQAAEPGDLGAMVAGSLLQNYAGYGGRGGAVAGAVGGALSTFGGLGGFGRKKAKATPAVAAAAPPPPRPAPANFVRTLSLDLGSTGAAATPAADHLPPVGLQAGAALPLVTPAKATGGHTYSYDPSNPEKPRGRMLIYWGCGETAPAPIIIDFATMVSGKKVPNLPTISANAGTPPRAGAHTTYGTWPNEKARVQIPANGSLAGEHVVRGNYSPEIRFALASSQDFMAPLNTTTAPLSSGATRVSWPAVPGATGYFAQVFGSGGNEDMVFWSSSGVPASMSNLMDWLPPSEVRRLIAAKAVMPPSQTECVVPTAVMKAAPSGVMQMIAYGDEANFAYPPKPANPKTAWNPEWTAKVRFKSTTTAMLGMRD